MPELKSTTLIAYYNSNLVEIKKLWEESVNRINGFDRISAELVSQITKNFQKAIIFHLPGSQDQKPAPPNMV